MDTTAISNLPTETCSRCAGSGSYSWNAVHGSRCYGCNGAGTRPTAAAQAILDEWQALAARIRRTSAADVRPGDQLAINRYGQVLSSTAGATWATVIETTAVAGGHIILMEGADGDLVSTDPIGWERILRRRFVACPEAAALIARAEELAR